MAETKPRRWLQLHLSTCVVMMFVASGLLWLNVPTHTRRVQLYFAESRVVDDVASSEHGERPVRGWPCDYLQHSSLGRWYFDPRSLIIDAFVAVLVVLAAGALCEWRIDRRLYAPGPWPWWRPHLSTLVLLALVAGILFVRQGATAWRSGAIYWGFPFEAYGNNQIRDVPAYVANLIINLAVAAVIGVKWERSVRRRERQQP